MKKVRLNETRTPVLFVVAFVFAFTAGLLIALWVLALIRTGGEKPAGCSVQEGDIPTFSCMLATDDVVRTLYFCWLSLYTLLTVVMQWIMYHVPLWEDAAPGRPTFKDQKLCSEKMERRLYVATTGLYTFLTAVEIISLILVGGFFVTNPDFTEVHYVFAGLAFGSHTLRCFLLFIRRLLAVHNPDYIGPNGKRRVVIFVANGLWCAVQVALLISFAVTLLGWLEFPLTLVLVLGQAWQLYDYHRDIFDVVMEMEEPKQPQSFKTETTEHLIPIPANISKLAPTSPMVTIPGGSSGRGYSNT